MNQLINTYSRPATQNTQASNPPHETRNSTLVADSIENQTVAWESPTVEAFDLCMEVTAYFQQGK